MYTILTLLLVGILTFGMVLSTFAVYVKNYIETDFDMSMFDFALNNSPTKFYYYDSVTGEPIELEGQSLHGERVCIYTKLEDTSSYLKNAIIAIEDKRFYEHDGVDWYRTVNAAFNFLFGKSRFGASTITQQLVKNITSESDYSVNRKIQEMFYAKDLENQMNKDEILELYLNVINLSEGCYGVGAAAQGYFNKTAAELTLLESTAIAAITNSPAYYNPINYPEHNKERRDIILTEMYKQEKITKEEFDENYGKDLELNLGDLIEDEHINSWYIDMVIEDVIDDLCTSYGYNEQTASMLVYYGGLKIYTAMDISVQTCLEEFYEDESNFPSHESGLKAQSSMIIIHPINGNILGVVGAVGEKTGNRLQSFATDAVRPSGSVIKPLSVYAPALDSEIITYATVYDDVPVSFGDYNFDSSQGEIVYPEVWPQNATMIYRGLTNINYAVEHSLNTVAVQVLEDLGVDTSFDFLKNTLNFESLIDEMVLPSGAVLTDRGVAALALGQMNYGVTVREVTAGYSIFTNKGVYNNPRSYLSVKNSEDEVILDNPYNGTPAISEASANIMTKMLENVVDYGTAQVITLRNDVDVAGKTGTSQYYFDRWFVGYTPYYIGGVWYGYEYPKAITGDYETQYVCGLIWNKVMTQLHEQIIADSKNGVKELEKFEDCEDVVAVEVCADSGLLPSAACRLDPRGDRIEVAYFIKGTEPTKVCNVHVLVDYDTQYGGVVDGSAVESNNTKKVALIKVERSFPMQFYITDAQYVYRYIPSDILPSQNSKEAFFANILIDNEYCGLSESEKQYNRYCSERFNYVAWLFSRSNIYKYYPEDSTVEDE